MHHARFASSRVAEELHDLELPEGLDHGVLVLRVDLQVLDGHVLLGARAFGSYNDAVGSNSNHLFNNIIVLKSRLPHWIEAEALQVFAIDGLCLDLGADVGDLIRGRMGLESELSRLRVACVHFKWSF